MFLAVNGCNMHVALSGPPGASALLLLHSLGTDLHVWDAQADALARSFRVIRPDLRGHGLSDVTPGPYTTDGLARDTLALLDALEVERAHVGGLSIGGMVAQAVAACAPGRVLSLILCDTAMAIPPPQGWRDRAALVRAQGIGPIEDAVLARWVTPAFRDTLASHGLQGHAAPHRAGRLRRGRRSDCRRRSDRGDQGAPPAHPGAGGRAGRGDAAGQRDGAPRRDPGRGSLGRRRAAHIPTVERAAEVCRCDAPVPGTGRGGYRTRRASPCASRCWVPRMSRAPRRWRLISTGTSRPSSRARPGAACGRGRGSIAARAAC